MQLRGALYQSFDDISGQRWDLLIAIKRRGFDA